MSKLSLIEQTSSSKKAQTCSSSSSSSSLSTSTVASRVASSKSTSITTSSKRRSTTSRHHHHQQQQQQQHHHHHQHQQQQLSQQQQQQKQLISETASVSSSGGICEQHTSDSNKNLDEESGLGATGGAMVHRQDTTSASTFSSSPTSDVAGSDQEGSMTTTTTTTTTKSPSQLRTTTRPVSALELRLKDQFKGDLFEEAEKQPSSSTKRSFQHELEEESRVRRREESTCISSTRKRTSCLLNGATGSQSSVVTSSSSSSQAAAATAATAHSRLQTSITSRHLRDGQSSMVANTTATSSSSDMSAHHHSFRTSASLLLSDNNNNSNNNNGNNTNSIASRSLFAGQAASGVFLTTSETDFSSPDARSIFREVGSEFAMLENAMIDSATRLNPLSSSSANFRLLTTSRRPLSPLGSSNGQYLAITGPSTSNSSSTSLNQEKQLLHKQQEPETERSKFSNSLSELSARLNPISNNDYDDDDIARSSSKNSSERIKELLNRVGQERPNDVMESDIVMDKRGAQLMLACSPEAAGKKIQDEDRKIFMSESIERIDQRMSELCVKLQQCKDSKEAIDLLKIIIQMIEKAWSVPVCGDDLGFKLCNSLREAGGLDFVLGFIQDTVESLMRIDCLVFSPGPSSRLPSEPESLNSSESGTNERTKPPQTATRTNSGASSKGLKLDLRKITDPDHDLDHHHHHHHSTPRSPNQPAKQAAPIVRDNDSDIITSDLGLDSTSVESLSLVSPAILAGRNSAEDKQQQQQQQQQEVHESHVEEVEEEEEDEVNKKIDDGEDEEMIKQEEKQDTENDDDFEEDEQVEAGDNRQSTNAKQPEIEEPAFLCARLLSQCLTSENRDYIVRNALDSVIRLACSFSTIKSSRIRRLLADGSLSPLASSETRINKQNNTTITITSNNNNNNNDSCKKVTTSAKTEDLGEKEQQQPTASNKQLDRCEHSDVHAVIGTEILQHLFKHSEETCHRMISLGGLQAILYGCRSSNVEVLRHCASALANLALYGGPEGQQRMIEQKAHVWLFPLAFNEDDNVQYYACLAIVVLVANKEIEADVLKSSTLNLVEPFVLSHEPQRFAESTTAHIHGQSASWLRKLIPLLESKRQEARNLACFHFAMEAHIKREQSQTELFREIGAVEPLRKVGSSPQAIASRFACQALRLIGEKEPHKLSQQVPLWTSEDVVEWVSQIGFERFRPAFVESRVDGDLLLQLDEDALKSDIGIDNGIIRRRFLRELTNLKRISDYSSLDKTGLCSMLTSASGNGSGQEFIQYVYPLLQLGVTKDTIHLFDCEQLLRECKVVNMIHQIKLAQTIKDIQERQAIEAATQECNSQNGQDQKTLDVFVSYRRSTGSQLASLLKVHLQLRGFSVFIDVERLEAGKFDNNLLDSIKAAKNFIIVLSPSALDRCVDDHNCKDWVHKEIVAALASNCNIIPIIDNFHWPDPEQLPEDMRSIIYFNGVRWIHDYQDACIDKVERFIRGEINNPGQFSAGSQIGSSTAQSSLQRLAGGGQAGSGNGSAYSISSPSIAATPSIGAMGNTHSPGQYQFSRPPPFDGYHHPLSYISQQLQQHSQNSQATATGSRRN